MIAAIYARKSPDDQNGIASDDKSVARQIAIARAFAAGRGWTVDDAHVFTDDRISGAEFARRPGLVRLLATLKRPPFGILLVSDRDRIGREQIEVAYILKQLVTSGVRVFEVAHDREITLTSPTDKVLSAVTAFAAELEREQARSRTRAALEHRARAGRSTGGSVFGYTATRRPDGHASRVIVPAEAEVIRRLFALAADGCGVRRIAGVLNAEAAPAPRKSGRSAGWAPSTVRSALDNALYHGIATWGRTQKRDAWGQRRRSRRDDAEHVHAAVPDLRIVDEALWQRAHERRDAGRALYLARVGEERGRAGGRPPSGSASRYLLSGLAECGQCGGSMFVRARTDRAPRWVCMTRHLRGVTVCKNALDVLLADVDAAVLGAVEHDLLRPEVLETALYKALEMIQAQDAGGQDAAEQGLRAELARLDAEVARLAGAIATGGDLPALVAALQEREQRRAHVRGALADRERQRARHASHDGQGDALDAMRAALADWRGLLQRETGPARAALQALLAGRLVFTPGEQDGRRFYAFEGAGTVSPIIAGIVCPKGSGPRTRTIPPAIRRALHHRDRGCRFPGCGVSFGQGHHLRHWAQGGPTTLSNLAMLCRRHHRAVHEEGFQVERRPDGELRFLRPDGRPLPDVPPPSVVPDDPIQALRARNEAGGLHLHARTTCPGWQGESLDVGWAIDVLHPRALQPLAIGE